MVAKAASTKISVERNLILARFEESIRALQAFVGGNMEQKVALKSAVTTVRELCKSGGNISESNCSEMIPKIDSGGTLADRFFAVKMIRSAERY